MLEGRYTGEFRGGKREGWGACYYATGAYYEGQWRADLKHGQGVFVFEDGTAREVTFCDDRLVLAEGAGLGPEALGSALRQRLCSCAPTCDVSQVRLAQSW